MARNRRAIRPQKGIGLNLAELQQKFKRVPGKSLARLFELMSLHGKIPAISYQQMLKTEGHFISQTTIYKIGKAAGFFPKTRNGGGKLPAETRAAIIELGMQQNMPLNKIFKKCSEQPELTFSNITSYYSNKCRKKYKKYFSLRFVQKALLLKEPEILLR